MGNKLYSGELEIGSVITIAAPIDPHAHFREPGTNTSETIASGSYAALIGGYQMAVEMPNTPDRPTHSEERLAEKQAIARRTSHIDIGFNAGVNLANPDLDQLPRMMGRAVGLKLFMGETYGNSTVYTLDDAREPIDVWIDEAEKCGLQAPIFLHAEGEIGAEVADYITRREHHAHWCHLSSAEEAEWSRKFTEERRQYFTSEVTPHHLTMTDLNAEQLGWPGGRMMPSLKKEADHDALIWAFEKGYISAIGTDHAPHPMEPNMQAERENPHGHTGEGCTACYGVSGIEFALPILMRQVLLGKFTLSRLQDAMYTQPLHMLGIDERQMPAKTVLHINPYRIEKEHIVGGSENTPYINRMAGAKVLTMTGRHRTPRVIEAQKKAS